MGEFNCKYPDIEFEEKEGRSIMVNHNKGKRNTNNILKKEGTKNEL